jgi:hypothetical protein
VSRLLGVVALVGLSLASPALAQESADIARVRAALDKYRDPIVAIHDGYFSTLACVEFPVAGAAGQMQYPAGAMGVHFLNTALIGPELDPMRPQVLIYEPVGDSLRLVAAEWFVPTEVIRTRPLLFGHPLDGPMEGHHPIMPPELHHWDVHVWLWKANPAGMFSPTNPDVRCPNRAYTFKEQPPKIIEH